MNRCEPIVQLDGVSLFRVNAQTRARKYALADVTWTVAQGEHWAIAGPNAAGKSTLARIAAARLMPSRGRATVLGETFGKTRMAELRRQVGLVDARLMREFYSTQTVLEVVLGGPSGVVVVLDPPAAEIEAARESLARFGVADLAARRFADCSEGERMRTMLARVLLDRPKLLVLDEPMAGLDLPGREAMLAALHRLVCEDPTLTSIVVSHHLEELPATTTHALLLRDGAAVASGTVDDTLSDAKLSECFGIPVTVDCACGRYFARAAVEMRATG